MASVMAVRNETESTSTRVTKEGRKLTYKLNVIQQPERARACGSGAKSSADRRPVDPPPVVELRIFEGDAMNEVTFSHNANFFLFVTLEAARPIAQGRVQQPPSFPVLTGMPVSGMAYLDRPKPAGYFLFPDLSVRHEGKYRLSFNLYEEVKDTKDANAEPPANHPDHPNNKGKVPSPMSPKAHVDWRLEVRSKPFTVFSAKKFPGLAESTALSRIVAEQGCRVRIRRDVRMRRRENKPAHEYDEYDEDAGYVRARATPTPDPYHQNHGLPSNYRGGDGPDGHHATGHPGVDGPSPYGVDSQQQQQPPPCQSGHDQGQYPQPQYAQQYPPAQGPPSGYSHMSSGASANGHYQYPHFPSAPPQNMVPAQQSHGYPPQQTNYPSHAPATQYPSSHTAPLQDHHRRGSPDSGTVSDYRQGSASYPQNMAAQTGPPSNLYTYSENGYGRPSSTFQTFMSAPPPHPISAPRTPAPPSSAHALPPLKMPLPLEPKFESLSSPTGPMNNSSRPGPPYPSPALESGHQRNSSYHQYSTPPATQPTAPEPGRSVKRAYDTVFDSSRYEQSYRNGMRPAESDHANDYTRIDLEDDEYDNAYTIQAPKMLYKRADGTEISRRLPASS
ncbi:MAG: velvet protein [Sclerophora amabilis]|nr:MAG: velvet protein [Sclerophora amabilis]